MRTSILATSLCGAVLLSTALAQAQRGPGQPPPPPPPGQDGGQRGGPPGGQFNGPQGDSGLGNGPGNGAGNGFNRGPGNDPGNGRAPAPPPRGGRNQPPSAANLLQAGPPGRWWDENSYVQKLSLSPAQQKKMDAAFDSSRGQLIDAQAAVQKAEVVLEPLLAADQPDEGKVLAQIDKIAQARAQLEKSNARMLLQIRRQLTPEQWNKLQAERPNPPREPDPNPPATQLPDGDSR